MVKIPDITKTKQCYRCKQYKYFNEFYKDSAKGKKDGLTSYCKDCQKKAVYIRRHADPIKTRKAERKKFLRKKYGITLEEYDQMFEQQGGVCAICGEPQLGKRLSVDHSHTTGKVRGLLCYICNTRLGILENKNWRIAAEKYLCETDDEFK